MLIKARRNKKNKKLDAVLGTRFSKDSKVTNYPFLKLFLNRLEVISPEGYKSSFSASLQTLIMKFL